MLLGEGKALSSPPPPGLPSLAAAALPSSSSPQGLGPHYESFGSRNVWGFLFLWAWMTLSTALIYGLRSFAYLGLRETHTRTHTHTHTDKQTETGIDIAVNIDIGMKTDTVTGKGAQIWMSDIATKITQATSRSCTSPLLGVGASKGYHRMTTRSYY